MTQDFHGNVGQVAGGDVVNRQGDTRVEVNIQGDNYGPISLDTPARADRHEERPINRYSQTELTEILRRWRSQWWSGWRGYWFNIPCMLLVALMCSLVGILFTGLLPVADPQFAWKILVPTILIMLVLAFWMDRIRRVEAQVMAESRAAINAIELELRKRR